MLGKRESQQALILHSLEIIQLQAVDKKKPNLSSLKLLS